MFGMKDYRAHKLYWLLSLPLRILGQIVFLGIAILTPLVVANTTHYATWLKIVISYVAFEAVTFLISLICIWFGYLFERLFYFLIDVEPSVGSGPEEAKLVLRRGGELVKLDRKMEKHIEEWDIWDDTDRYVKLTSNWLRSFSFRSGKGSGTQYVSFKASITEPASNRPLQQSMKSTPRSRTANHRLWRRRLVSNGVGMP